MVWAAVFFPLLLAFGRPVQAHDLTSRGIHDFSDSLINFITVDSSGFRTSIPNSFNGDIALGFTVDRCNLIEGDPCMQEPMPGRAKVFHEHFRGDGPFASRFHGTVVFTVFNGPDFDGDPILPPGPVTYVNANHASVAGASSDPNYPQYSIEIDFGSIDVTDLGQDDQGTIQPTDWIFAYVVINDEGDVLLPATVGRRNASISFNQISYAPRLREMLADVPDGFGVAGTTISSGGDVESSLPLPTNNPARITFRPSFRGDAMAPLFLTVFYDDSQGGLPDLSERGSGLVLGPEDVNRSTSNMIVMTSPFGPAVSNISHTGGSDAATTEENVLLAPMTWPDLNCEAVDIKVDPLGPIPPGSDVRFTVTIRNNPPATDPNDYGYAGAPPGTQRGVYDVDLSVLEGAEFLDNISGQVRVTTEIFDRVATAEFTATYVGPGSVTVRPTVMPSSPYRDPPFSDDPRFMFEGSVCDVVTIFGNPVLEIAKDVEFICFLDPNDPNQTEIRVPDPGLPVPPCGLVRYTITVTNGTISESLTNVVVTDCLPQELAFRGASIPTGVSGTAPSCDPFGGTDTFVFPIPVTLQPKDEPGDSFSFTIDAIVEASATPGLKTNFARGIGFGVESGLATDVVTDSATIDVQRVDGLLDGLVNEDVRVCTDQVVTLRYRFENTGEWTLDPVRIEECDPDPGIVILSQDPPAGTGIRDLTPGASFEISVMARVTATTPERACVGCSVSAQPDCYDPRDVEDCEIERMADQCVEVVVGEIEIVSLQVDPPCVDPGEEVSLDLRIRNTGSTAFSDTPLMCAVDVGNPGLEIVDCPASGGPLGPGEEVDVVVRVRSSLDLSGIQCLDVKATGVIDELPTECHPEDDVNVCLEGRPRVLLEQTTQLVCFLDPGDPTQTTLIPPVPAASASAPPCGLMRFTVRVDNPTPNESLENVRVSICLPPELAYRNRVTPPLSTGAGGPPCPPGSSRTVLVLPDLPAGGSFAFTYDAVVLSTTGPGLLAVVARASGRGRTTQKDAVPGEGMAEVMVESIAAMLEPGLADPDFICPRQETMVTFLFRNQGTWPLDILDITPLIGPGLRLIDIAVDPAPPVDPGQFTTVSLVLEAREGSFADLRCVSLGVTAQPTCADPREGGACQLTRQAGEICIEVFNLDITLSCPRPVQPANRGDNVSLAFLLRNTGEEACENLDLALTIVDTGLTVVQGPADIDMLPPGAMMEVEVVVRADEQAEDGEYCVTLMVTCLPGDDAPPDCEDSPEATCCLRLDSIPIPGLGPFGLSILGGMLGLMLFVRVQRRLD